MVATSSRDKNEGEIDILREENERLRGQRDLLADLGRRVTASLDFAKVLQDVVDAACDLTLAQYGALAVFDPSGHVLEFVTHGVTQQQRERIGPLPEGRGLLGWLQEHQAPVRLADLSKHPRSAAFRKTTPR